MENTMLFYSGFWRRFFAYLIDSLILGAVNLFVFIPFVGLLGLNGILTAAADDGEELVGLLVAAITALLFAMVLVMVISWLYYALMESSEKGATLGKMAIGLRVTDLEGKRITFGRATGRYFGKIITNLTLGIGYLMIVFTEKKQALHDLISSCVVIRVQ